MRSGLVIATFNEDKIEEYKEILNDLSIELLSLKTLGVNKDKLIENGQSFEENAYQKAYIASSLTGMPAIGDDSGLEVDALGGKPGIYSARYGGVHGNYKLNNETLLKDLNGVPFDKRTARFKCVIVFLDMQDSFINKKIITQGVCEGIINLKPEGDYGFGYDPLFYIPQLKKTMSQLSMEEKNKISHRGIAGIKMVDHLKSYWNL